MDYINVTSNIIEQSNIDNNNFNNINNINDSIRRINNTNDTFQNTSTNIDNYENNNEKLDDNNVPIGIYRYKFMNKFTEELFKFSKIHQYDHRKDFKDAWDIWMDNNNDLIDEEVRHLTNLGYDGDIIDKMFKSARYYFRKKSTEKKAPSKRRIYVGTQKDLLEAMDDHIKMNINSGDFKPSDGFDEFCKKNIDILKEQINILCKAGFTDPNEIKLKIKKTYKNRYFLIISK
jgi:hypothetical protein